MADSERHYIFLVWSLNYTVTVTNFHRYHYHFTSFVFRMCDSQNVIKIYLEVCGLYIAKHTLNPKELIMYTSSNTSYIILISSTHITVTYVSVDIKFQCMWLGCQSSAMDVDKVASL